MTWFKVDDGFYDHPKLDHISLEAIGLWLLCGTYCARHLTDGLVSPRAVIRIGGTPQLTQELVDAGLWVVTPDGYQYHDWLDHQPPRDEVLERRESNREATKERVRRHRERKRAERESVTGNAPVTTVTPPFGNAPVTLPPTRPDPTRPDPEVHKSVAQKRATPPPPALPITDAMRQWAATKAPGVNLDDETERLLDWARANGKTYRDWTAAWRNWIKKSKDFAPVNGNRPTPIPPTFDAAALRPADPIPMPDNVRHFKGVTA